VSDRVFGDQLAVGRGCQFYFYQRSMKLEFFTVEDFALALPCAALLLFMCLVV
jgi:hypothetical protein